GPGGELLSRDDLPEALDGLPGEQPWRVHFHLPLHAAPALPLANTDAELVAAARALLGGERALTDHLEVETYTWTCCRRVGGPPAARPWWSGSPRSWTMLVIICTHSGWRTHE